MNQPKISVIIPVYNTENYVKQAAESIMSQTLKELEIIIINDGSTDKSAQVIEKLAESDARIQVYTQKNKGQSTTRNTALTYAKGKYIYFMDSDDLLEKDAMELCYRKCENENLDFVFFDAVCFIENNVDDAPALTYTRTHKMEDKVYTGNEALKLQLQHNVYTPSPCLSLIRKSFIADNHLAFYPGIIHEDQLFTTLAYLEAKRTACIARTFFHRRLRKDSTMTCRFSERNLKGYLTVTREILKTKKEKASPEVSAIIDLYLSQMLNAVVRQAFVLKLPARIGLAMRCFFYYKRYVATQSIGILLAKSMFRTSNP